MCERNYKNLPLDRTNLRELVTNYLQGNSFDLHKDEDSGTMWRLEFFKTNSKTCLITIYLNKDGTSTILYKQGQNQETGKIFADYLYDSINPDELLNIDMTLINIKDSDFNVVLDTLKSEFSDIDIDITTREHDKLIHIKSSCYKDSITLIYYNNRKLRIQGKPLTCYKRFIYYISDLLNLVGIESVLMKLDSNRSEVLNSEVAEFHLKKQIGEDVFDTFPQNIKTLLISSFCVKFSSPKLPDYTMLLYPEFRSLEGMIKNKLLKYELVASAFDDVDSFGGFFLYDKAITSYRIKQEYLSNIPCEKTHNILCDAYTYFCKHRNSLFHMNEHVNSSRMISDINDMNRISNSIYDHLKSLA